MEFVKITSGEFLMGSPNSEKGRVVHEEQRKISLEKAHYHQITPVTVGQWKKFTDSENYLTTAEKENWAWGFYPSGKNRLPFRTPDYQWKRQPGCNWKNPGFNQTDNHPVTCVSWDDAVAFVNWINKKDKFIYSLPSEEQWEYCCRANTYTAYSFGNRLSTGQANFRRRISSNLRKILPFEKDVPVYQTTMVKRYKPNNWGLYDMHGNVWEWCLNSCDVETGPGGSNIITNTYLTELNQENPKEGTHRILRGGSWFYGSKCCRSAFRRSLSPNERSSGIGFRLVCLSHDGEI